MEINGIAHIIITVSRFDECVTFYRRLLPFIGLNRMVHDQEDYFYCIGGRTAFALAHPRTSMRSGGLLLKPALESSVRRNKGTGRRATTRPCSRIRTVCDWKSITFQVRAYSPLSWADNVVYGVMNMGIQVWASSFSVASG